MKKNDDQYFGTTTILESEPIDIPDARRCRVNHGLVAAVPFEDTAFGVFRKKLPAYKARLKSLQKRKRESEERIKKETERRNRELEKAILKNYKGNNEGS